MYPNCASCKEKIDVLLQEMAAINAQLGTDSTQEELTEARLLRDYFMSKVLKIDPSFSE